MWRPGNEAHKSALFFWNCRLHLWNRTSSWWCINIIYTVLYNPAGSSSSSSMSRSPVSVSESFSVVQPLSCICLSAVLQNVFTWLDVFTGPYSVSLVALTLPPAFDCDLLTGEKCHLNHPHGSQLYTCKVKIHPLQCYLDQLLMCIKPLNSIQKIPVQVCRS